MAAQQHPDDLAQLRAELAAQRHEITRLQRRRHLPFGYDGGTTLAPTP